MTTRRQFLRQGALYVAAVAAGDLLWEPKRLWAFPVNPLGSLEGLSGATYAGWEAGVVAPPLTEEAIRRAIAAIVAREPSPYREATLGWGAIKVRPDPYRPPGTAYLTFGRGS